MRTDRRFQALISVQAALTALKGSRAVHCKAQEHSAAHLQGGCVLLARIPLSSVSQMTLTNFPTSLIPAGFQRGAIKPRVVPFQLSLQAVGLSACMSRACCAFATENLQEAVLTCKAAKRVDCNIVTLQAKDKFEQWHAEKWLSPRRVLQKAGAEMRPVLLPFWLFEAAIKVEYAAQV